MVYFQLWSAGCVESFLLWTQTLVFEWLFLKFSSRRFASPRPTRIHFEGWSTVEYFLLKNPFFWPCVCYDWLSQVWWLYSCESVLGPKASNPPYRLYHSSLIYQSDNEGFLDSNINRHPYYFITYPIIHTTYHIRTTHPVGNPSLLLPLPCLAASSMWFAMLCLRLFGDRPLVVMKLGPSRSYHRLSAIQEPFLGFDTLSLRLSDSGFDRPCLLFQPFSSS